MTPPAPPPVTLELAWQGDLRLVGRADGLELVLDGKRQAGPSPTQALGFALAGCMAIDVVHVLTKGRFALTGLGARLSGERRSEEPRYFTRVELRFTVTGDVPPHAVERAIALSREKYCSVLHSLRLDLDLRTSFEIVAPKERAETT